MNTTILEPTTHTASEELLYRRQFILGPQFISGFRSWKKFKLNDFLYITHHPELPICHVQHEDKALTLVGYILDPINPSHSDLDILNSLLKKIKSAHDIFELTSILGGRWILIVQVQDDIRLFHDATGTRQIVYTVDQNAIWCASQSGLIAEYLGFQVDEEIKKEFINSKPYSNAVEYWFPDDTTPFKQIKLLLPNHYLDLRRGNVTRYWPNKSITPLELQEGVKKCATILQGLFESAANRFKLALTMTAGFDSRVLLATSRNIRKKVYYYTLVLDCAQDIKVPADLLPELGLKHNLIFCPQQMSEDFKEIYERNVIEAHPYWGRLAQGILEHFPKDRVAIKGNAGEVARVFYRLDKHKAVNGKAIAEIFSMEQLPFVINHFDEWLSKASGPAKQHNLHILDLFYWEQRMGQWQAMSQLEWDIAQEVFTPFNCRELLTTMLSVDEKYRKGPNYLLYKEIIKFTWPETLNKPINPKPPLKALVVFSKKKLKALGLFYYIKRIRNLVINSI